ncbi:MAG: hypothetical protein ACRESE_09185, partial [Gammaproteobacteria bacterium]
GTYSAVSPDCLAARWCIEAMGELNDSQKRYTLSVLSGVNRHLEVIEELLQAHKPLFGELHRDITPAESTTLKVFAANLRAEILDLDRSFHLQRSQDLLSMRWGVDTHLQFASVELQGLTRSKLAGYGALDDQAFQDLKIQIDRLRRIIELQIERLGAHSDRNQD